MSLKEYKSGQAFPGVIGRTFDVSKPAWPAPNRARDTLLLAVISQTLRSGRVLQVPRP